MAGPSDTSQPSTSRGRGRRQPTITSNDSDEIQVAIESEAQVTTDSDTLPPERQSGSFDPQAALANIDPALLLQVVAQLVNKSSNNTDSTQRRDEKPPTYAVSKLPLGATFQDRADWLQAVEQGNATREGRPGWLYAQWASTWMEPEIQRRWRSRISQLHNEDFKLVSWKEFKDFVNSDYLGGNSAEIDAQKQWMSCAQNGRSPQEFYDEWSTLVRRIPEFSTEGIAMARDYWLRLDIFYHNKYIEAGNEVKDALECARWCELVWVSRAHSRNGRERDAHRKRPASPTNLEAAKKFARTADSIFSGPRTERARIIGREVRETQSHSPGSSRDPQTGRFQSLSSNPVVKPYSADPGPTRHAETTSTNASETQSHLLPTERGVITCHHCGKPGHIRRYCPDIQRPISSPNATPVRVQALGVDLNEATSYPDASDSDSESENGGR